MFESLVLLNDSRKIPTPDKLIFYSMDEVRYSSETGVPRVRYGSYILHRFRPIHAH